MDPYPNPGPWATNSAAVEPAVTEQADAPEDEQDHRSTEPKRRRRPSRAVWIGTGGVLLGLTAGLIGGAGIGVAGADPTTTEQYQGLARDKQGVEAERDQARTERDQVRSDYETVNNDYLFLKNGIEGREDDVTKREAAVTQAEGKVKTDAAAVKKREDAVTKTEQTKAANTVSDGAWTVGTDIEPGTYRATAAVDSTCYWEITATGSNGENILQNDLPGGGRPSVALAVGQDFQTQRCGSWEKQ
ncbi:hypothetical protein [Tersicoccus sp. Bi-70]|uniref:hypothetical protein n=1 Tax=Tersicoccus sp. Bi-70 TaxID=1897634 RepID=UPI0009757006|nr:hypothetical protein [Tersicoccus sp. Bi-70]OMH36876.1 hypothetical protein BGP79_14130 [Tersicoccus sp. Bi-70]